MAGGFSKTNRPLRAGNYTNFIAAVRARVPVPLQGTIALPIVHDWGPMDETVDINSVQQFREVYGESNTQGARAVAQAFKGEGLDQIGGAAKVLVHRFAGSAAAKAARSITNTTPVAAITLTAIYEGDRGELLTTQIVADGTNPSTHYNLVISNEYGELERYIFVKTNVTDLAAQVNGTGSYSGGGSEWVVASAVTSGVALTIDGSAVALTGGNDGATLVAGDWTAVRTALESKRFSVFVPFDMSDTSLQAAFNTWVTNQNEAGRRFLAVFGGAVGESSATALTRADTFANENVATIGVGTYNDSELLDSNGDPVDLSTSELAPRIAGIIAARGETSSISFARLADVSIVTGPTEAEIENCIEGGVLTLSSDSDEDAPVHLEAGITTYQANTTAKPHEIFSQIKFVRTMHGLERDIEAYNIKFVIGKLPVNDDTRETLVGKMKEICRARVLASSIQDDFEVDIDQEPPPSDDDDFIQLRYGVQFTRSTEKVFNSIYVG